MTVTFIMPEVNVEPLLIPVGDDSQDAVNAPHSFLMEESNWMKPCPFNLGLAASEELNSMPTAIPIPS